MMIYTEIDGRVCTYWDNPEKTLTLEKRQRPRMYHVNDQEMPKAPDLVPGLTAFLYVKEDAEPTIREDGTKELSGEDFEWIIKEDPEEMEKVLAKKDRELTKAANAIFLKPKVHNEELTSDEMVAIRGLFPDYQVDKAYTIGDIFNHERKLYEVLQDHTSQDDWKPEDTPALYKNHTPVGEIEEWRQPLGAHDAYMKDVIVLFNGKQWKSLIDNNVWAPNVYGWVLVEEEGNDYPDWKQPEGAHDAYPKDFIVKHNDKLWKNTINDNVWEPGVYGWVEYTP